MARKGRKQLAVQIKEELFDKLEQIKEELNLSNAKIIEMFIENYNNTPSQLSVNTSANTGITEEALRRILKEELANTSINTQTQEQVTPPEPKPKKEKKKPEPPSKPNPTPKQPDEIDFTKGLIETETYTLRKPGYQGNPEKQHTRKTNLMVEWWLEEGDSQYYDEFQNIIPFRYKKADGTDYLPTPFEIKMLEEAYEKPVVVEE